MNVVLAVRMIIAGAALAVLPACNTTDVQSARHPAAIGGAPVRNIMVIGVDQRTEVRNPFENDVVASLRKRGVEGTASYAQFSFDEINSDKELIRQRLLTAKQESVLVVRVTAQNDFVDGPPASLGSMDMGAVDESRYNAFTTPGGDINTRFRLGARLYRVSDGAVIWSAVLGETMKEGADPSDFIGRTAKTIVERLAGDKLIP